MGFSDLSYTLQTMYEDTRSKRISLADTPHSTLPACDCPTGNAGCANNRATSFTIDGEAVIAGPDGVAAFDELHGRRRLGRAFRC
jgi:hypothetical protein